MLYGTEISASMLWQEILFLNWYTKILFYLIIIIIAIKSAIPFEHFLLKHKSFNFKFKIQEWLYLVLLVNGGTSTSNLILTNQNSAEYAIKKKFRRDHFAPF